MCQTSSLFSTAYVATKASVQVPVLVKWFVTLWVFTVRNSPRPTPKMEKYPLSAVRDCLFNVHLPYLQAVPPSETWLRPNIKHFPRNHFLYWRPIFFSTLLLVETVYVCRTLTVHYTPACCGSDTACSVWNEKTVYEFGLQPRVA